MRIIVPFCVIHAVAALIPLLASGPDQARPLEGFGGWPEQVQGIQIFEVPLGEVERRFAERFPGRVGRFNSVNGEEIVLRWIAKPTRSLHPAADCYRGSGYSVTPLPIRKDLDGFTWGCFRAVQNQRELQICERIFDQQGRSWNDVSSWFWHAALARSAGPWWSVTVARSSAGRP